MTPRLDEMSRAEQIEPGIDSLRTIESLIKASLTKEPAEADRIEGLRRALGDTACRRLGLCAIPAGLRLSVVMPVYNERATLDAILRRVEAVPIEKEIILIDDSSNDGTRELVRAREGRPGYVVVYHDRNRGKGAAVRAGFERTTGDIILVQDADLEYDPEEYLRLVQPIVEGRADVVYGSRFLTDGPRRAQAFWHTLGNAALTGLSNVFTNLRLTDMETCYKVFRREALESISPTLKQNRFGIEAELTAKVARRKHRVFEVPISYAGRGYGEGKKIGWRDALAAVYCVLRYAWRD